MSRFHINPESGEPGECSAEEGKCPFGGEHYDSKQEARKAYEESMNPFSSPDAMKRMQSEPLLEELQEWLEPGPFGNFLNHPLVQDMMVDAMPGMANMRLREKQKRVKRALEQQDWSSYIFLHERPYRLQSLQTLLYEHPVDKPGSLVRSVWMDSENIHQNYDEWHEVLTDFGIDMDESDKEHFQALPKRFEIYRGCTRMGEDGFSWTLDREKAEWFAIRFDRPGAQILETEVAKESVLALLTGRGESEVVILPEEIVRESLRRTRLS